MTDQSADVMKMQFSLLFWSLNAAVVSSHVHTFSTVCNVNIISGVGNENAQNNSELPLTVKSGKIISRLRVSHVYTIYPLHPFTCLLTCLLDWFLPPSPTHLIIYLPNHLLVHLLNHIDITFFIETVQLAYRVNGDYLISSSQS